MPSYPLSQCSDLDDIMYKQLLNLDLREQSSPVPSLGLPARTPGYVGQQRSSSSASLSCLPDEAPENGFSAPHQWGVQSESPLTSPFARANIWGKSGFFTQRSVSMVETSSASIASLGWHGGEFKPHHADISPTALHASSSSSSSSTSSVCSSSSRYKTELCRSFTESGFCKYGGKCQFAHGAEELRDLNRHPKYKTEPCRTFHTIGFCPYGVRCHFVHNGEEEKPFSRSSSFSSSSSAAQPLPSSSPTHRRPLIRQSFSFAGFPSAPPLPALNAAPPPLPLASPPSCADVSEVLSCALLEMDSAFEASPAQQQAPAAGPHSPFLPSPDSGCSPCGLSPNGSPSLQQGCAAAGGFSESLGGRSLSYTSLSDPDQDGSSSASSLSGSESCARRLAVFSQLSVPEDTVSFCL